MADSDATTASQAAAAKGAAEASASASAEGHGPHAPEETVAGAVEVLLRVQRERMDAYRDLRSHFEQYLGGGPSLDFATFRRHVDSITQRFQRLSAEVLAQQPRFEEAERDDLLVALGTLQRLESAKLAKTAVAQLLEQQAEHPDASQDISQADAAVQLKDAKKELNKLEQELADAAEELRYELD